MALVTPPSVVKPFAADATDPTYKRTIPLASQISITPGAASFTDGFPPLNMTPKTSGGIPPAGSDMNGILYMLSAWVAWLAAGAGSTFDQNVVDEMGGYPEGAVLHSALDPAQFFYSDVADNINDPDDDPTDWIPFNPLSNPVDLQTEAPTAGSYNNVSVGPNVGFLDVDTTDGDVTYTGITAGKDGQVLVVANTGANLLTLAALSGSSASANQIRFPADLAFSQNDSGAIRYSAQIGKWTRM